MIIIITEREIETSDIHYNIKITYTIASVQRAVPYRTRIPHLKYIIHCLVHKHVLFIVRCSVCLALKGIIFLSSENVP